MKSPAVSVVMAVYNGGDYLADAVESILNQTLDDFEFIIINDGSSDKSLELLTGYAKKDKRIKLLSQKNQGLVASLNRGIKAAKGKYVARQDADDRSGPKRLEKQVWFLEAHPKVVVVGSGISIMDDKSRIVHRHAVLLDDPELRQELLVRSPFAHGTVMFRREAAVKAGLYDPGSWPAEDFDLWLRLSAYGQLANLDDSLYMYREHPSAISVKNARLQVEKLEAVRQKAWRERGRLLPKRKIDLSAYKNLNMGQLRIERIIDNNVMVSKLAWKHGQKNLALKNMAVLAGNKLVYKKAAGKLKRKIRN
ncbi:MAG TPA: glycosyltransferase [Candidatus Nitrosopolaris sp.]|nr:glycosyltransferase [Candidatus Nitrosopolaris sp.]